MDNRKRFEFLKQEYRQGFPAYCGIEVVNADAGYFEVKLTVGPEHGQREGFVHAGVLATMADHTAGYAAYTLVAEDVSILTIELKINYFKPVTGDTVVCRSKIIHQGRRILVAESELFSALGNQEKRVSKAVVTLMAVSGSG
ncbi:MAG: PaaI family thioesterase [Desulfobacterales bacterium]|nr:PaaI family thioesterase [Desulfobacterales bacterium]